ncbi:MAG: hypothetical protein ACE5JR_14060 [Gemmatimonadota bacterium]
MDEKPPRTDFRRLLLEGVLIVASILLAFGIEAWWVRSREHAAEIEALQHLRGEFTATAERLAQTGERHESIRRSAKRLLGMTGPTLPAHLDTLAVDSLLMDLLGAPTVEPETVTLDALIGAGRLDLLSSPDLRRELASWSSAMADLAQEEQLAVEQMDQRFLPLIWDHVPVVTLDVTALADEYGDIEPSRFPRRYRELFQERRFENAIEERMNSSRRSLRDLRRVEGIVQRIVQLTDRELSR